MAQHHVEVVVAAEGVVPGKPVHQRQRLLGEEWPALQRLLLVRREHAVGVDDALRQSGRSGSEQDFRDHAGAGRGGGLLDDGAGRRAREIVEQRHAFEIGAVAARHDFGGAADRRQRVRERRGVGDVNEAGLEQLGDVLQLRKVLALQRVGDRDRRDRNAGGVARKHQQRMVDRIRRQDHHRALRRKSARDQRRGERIDRRPRLRVGQLAPAVVHALLQERARGLRLRRGAKQPRRDSARRRRARASEVRRIVPSAESVVRHTRRREGDRTVRGGSAEARASFIRAFSSGCLLMHYSGSPPKGTP